MVPRRRVAGPHPWYAPPPPRPPSQARPLVPANVIHVTPPPSQASRLGKRGGSGRDNPQHLEPQDMVPTGAGWGRITHNTGNHRAPSPSPPPRHTDDNDGDDVVHNDIDVLFPVWLLVVPFLLCCSGLRHRMFIALFS